MSTRRTFLIALATGAISVPFVSFAQPQGKVRRIGFLWEAEQSTFGPRLDAFKAAMRELGYVEGRDYVIEQRSAQNDSARLPALAAELVALKVNMIVSTGTPSAVAARKATLEISILTTTAGDPVGSGLAVTLRRPGGNVTGLTGQTTELYTKRLDLLRQILPGLRRVGFLYAPDNASGVLGLRQFESDCDKLKLKPVRAPARKAEEFATAFDTLKREQVQGLIVTSNSAYATAKRSIIDRAAMHGLPAMYGRDIYAEAGGLISYAANATDLYRRAAAYADKIFKGAKPGNLPIEQPNKFELVVNLKTAKALGITIPQSILVSADKVIE